MTAQIPSIAPASEGEMIVAMIAARLDRLADKDDSRAAIARIAEADERYRSLPDGGALTGLLAVFDASEADRAILLTSGSVLKLPHIKMR